MSAPVYKLMAKDELLAAFQRVQGMLERCTSSGRVADAIRSGYREALDALQIEMERRQREGDRT